MSGPESEHTRRAHREVIRSEAAAHCWAQVLPRSRGAPQLRCGAGQWGRQGHPQASRGVQCGAKGRGSVLTMVSFRLASSRSLRTSFSSSSLDEPQSCQGEGMSDQPEKHSRPQRGPQTTRRAVGCFVAARKRISIHPCYTASIVASEPLFRRVFNTNRK